MSKPVARDPRTSPKVGDVLAKGRDERTVHKYDQIGIQVNAAIAKATK